MSATKPWYKKWWGITLFVFFGISVIANLGEKPTQSNVDSTQSEETSEQVVFDLESLYGKNIDEVRAILGEPIDGELTDPSGEQIGKANDMWDNTFEKGEYVLLVTFNAKTREVVDFFTFTDDPAGLTKDLKSLEGLELRLNVKDSPNFIVEPYKALHDPSSYTGIVATPKK